VLAVAAAGCTGGSSSAYGAGLVRFGAPAPRLVLSPCAKQVVGSPDPELSYSCGTLAVPVDPARPNGPTLPMFVLRERLVGQTDRLGSLVINPGGPGGSGVEYALPSGLRREVLQRYDLVTFDPRGVGRSDPVRCVPATPVHPRGPDTRADGGFSAALADATRVANACYAKYGDRLAVYNTTAVAHDMELLRQALGEPKLTYLGYSYGTFLGAVYATLYPDRVRAMVLDGAVDPNAGELSNQEDQARGFEDAYDRFAADCLRRHCPLGRDPRAFLIHLLAKDKVSLGTVTSLLYSKKFWPQLEQTLAFEGHSDIVAPSALQNMLGDPVDSYDNFEDAYRTIRCVDRRDRVTEAQARSALTDWALKYPLFGKREALSLLECLAWKAPQKPPPAVHAPTTAAPILVVGTRHDPASPYAWAQRMQATLGNATLLTWDSDGHTAYLQNRCITDAVDDFLIHGTVPKDRTCPPN
jgi:pimeloyl-ACP methyl ester carboxylesterase